MMEVQKVWRGSAWIPVIATFLLLARSHAQGADTGIVASSTVITASDESEIAGIIERGKKAKDKQEMVEIGRELNRAVPGNAKDVDLLVVEAQSGKLRYEARECLKRMPGPLDAAMRAKLTDLIDIKDDSEQMDMLQIILGLCVKHEIPEAREKLRKTIKKTPKLRIRERRDLEIIAYDREKGKKDKWVRLRRISLLGRALARMKDIESLDMILDRDEVLVSDGASDIALMGLPALEKAVEVAKHSTGERREGALRVVGSSRYPDAFPKLRSLLKDNDWEVRRKAMFTLGRAKVTDFESILKTMQGDPNEKISGWATDELYRSYPDRYKAEILSSIYNKGPIHRMVALRIVASGTLQGVERELEEFIIADEKVNPNDTLYRRFAAEGIWRLSGKKINYKGRHMSGEGYPWDDEKKH